MRKLVLLFFVLGLALAQATPLVDEAILRNTGLGAEGEVDLNWWIVSNPSGSVTPYHPFIATSGKFPFGYWFNNSPASKWLTPQRSYVNPEGAYSVDAAGEWVFEASFDVAQNPGDYKIIGKWAMDNYPVEILLNGVTVMSYAGGSNGFREFQPFMMTEGFQQGANTLQFVVLNGAGGGGNPVGFRAELEASTPEPATFALFGFALIGLGAFASRLKKH
jgi:hypothetical protein